MGNYQDSNNWGGCLVIGLVIICLVVVSSLSRKSSVASPVAIHTTEAVSSPEPYFHPKKSRPAGLEQSHENYLDYPTGAPTPPPIWTSPPPVVPTPPPIWATPPPVVPTPPPLATEEPGCPSGIPGVYPDALDPVFRKCQAKKMAACYTKCHSIDPLYFFYNP